MNSYPGDALQLPFSPTLARVRFALARPSLPHSSLASHSLFSRPSFLSWTIACASFGGQNYALWIHNSSSSPTTTSPFPIFSLQRSRPIPHLSNIYLFNTSHFHSVQCTELATMEGKPEKALASRACRPVEEMTFIQQKPLSRRKECVRFWPHP